MIGFETRHFMTATHYKIAEILVFGNQKLPFAQSKIDDVRVVQTRGVLST